MRKSILPRSLRALALLAALACTPQLLAAQIGDRLFQGRILRGSVGFEGFSEHAFDANDPGVLTVVVRATDGSDLVIVVTDAAGQPLPNGRSDQDLGGDPGAEQFAVTIPRIGLYKIRIESYSGGQASYQVGVSWIPFPDVEEAPDPDGSPSSALTLDVDQKTFEDSIDGSAGDNWDWFVYRAEAEGTLTVATRTDGGDLVLEAFNEGEYTEPTTRSDQDLQGNAGNEAVTLVVSPGQTFYFKVSAFSDGAHIPYTIQVGFIGQ